jgi:hypothetical protein
MIALVALAVLPTGVVTPTIVSGQSYVCAAQGILPRFERRDGTTISIEGNDWLFDATLADLTGVSRATASISDGEMTLSAPVGGDPTASFKGMVVQEEGDSRVVLDWSVRRPDSDIDEETLVRSGLAICDLSSGNAAQEKKS